MKNNINLIKLQLEDISWSAIIAGILAAFVGFASTFTLIIQALLNTGATLEQAITGLMAVSIGMGVAGSILSLKYKMPISVAWSTPGAALLIGMKHNNFANTVGAMIMASILFIMASLWKPLNTIISKIPVGIASAMLAGIILNLCIAPVHAFSAYPTYMGLVIITWLIMLKVHRVLAIPCTAIVTLIVIYILSDVTKLNISDSWPRLNLVIPIFQFSDFINISIPLFIVTMASQNLPGFAVLDANGYKPKTRPLLFTTGLSSLLVAPFGGPSIGLAAITAAICAGEDVGDKSKRYWAGVICGLIYIIFGVLSSVVTKLIYLAPPILIEAVAGLALMGALSNSLINTLKNKDERDAAIVTFLITISGHLFFGISGAFWGLIFGVFMFFFLNHKYFKYKELL